MQKNLYLKVKEALSSVLPITLIVLILSVTAAPISGEMMCAFIAGAILLTIGTGVFTLGADVSMVYMGEKIGKKITATKKLPLIALSCLLIGTLITIAEPDLRVLAGQVGAIPDMTLIISVAVGVGIFLVFAFLRILFQLKMRIVLLVLYTITFSLAISPLIPDDFIPLAFDSGGATTGPITVPFILALGFGLATMRGDKTSQEDTFGLVALASIGPILTVLTLGAVYGSGEGAIKIDEVAETKLENTKDVFHLFTEAIPEQLIDIAIALIPIAIICTVYNFILIKLPAREMQKVLYGFGITFVGLTLFMTGVNVGFMPVGRYIGSYIGGEYSWLLVPLGVIIGYFIVAAEPAVHVLKKQVEDVTSGRISGKALGNALAVGVSVAVGLAMLRLVLHISIFYFLIPGYLIALIAMFFVPPLYTSVAFDSGGVASGPMTATFLLPLALGACDGIGGNPAKDAFGVLAFVAMTPLIAIQLLGIFGNYKERRFISSADLDEIIDV